MTTVDDRPRLTTWGEVIRSLHSLRREDIVCFADGPGSADDPCLVADSRTLADDEDIPPEAQDRRWYTALGKDQIEDVIVNLSLQTGSHPDEALILQGLKHYVDNDAYLTAP